MYTSLLHGCGPAGKSHSQKRQGRAISGAPKSIHDNLGYATLVISLSLEVEAPSVSGQFFNFMILWELAVQ